MKVLIADDSKLMRERIREAISIFREVEIVSEAETGLQTSDFLNKHNPDLAILDIRMPDRSGLEVLKEFRLTNKTTKIIMLTNYAYDQYRDRSIENGADYFFSKSDDFDKLAAVVATMLKNKHSEKEPNL